MWVEVDNKIMCTGMNKTRGMLKNSSEVINVCTYCFMYCNQMLCGSTIFVTKQAINTENIISNGKSCFKQNKQNLALFKEMCRCL